MLNAQRQTKGEIGMPQYHENTEYQQDIPRTVTCTLPESLILQNKLPEKNKTIQKPTQYAGIIHRMRRK